MRRDPGARPQTYYNPQAVEILDRSLWRLAPGVSLVWHDWPPHAVVFDRGSGNTHLLDEPAAEVLRAIASTPCREADLLDVLGADPSDPAAKAWLHALLQRFVALTLVDG